MNSARCGMRRNRETRQDLGVNLMGLRDWMLRECWMKECWVRRCRDSGPAVSVFPTWLPQLHAVRLINQPTPMRRILMTPFWTMIIPSNEVIPTYEITACHNVATVGIPFQVTDLTDLTKVSCLLLFLIPIWTFKCSTSWSYHCSISWTVTRWAWAWAWVFLRLYCWRVFWLRAVFLTSRRRAVLSWSREAWISLNMEAWCCDMLRNDRTAYWKDRSGLVKS